MNELFLYPIIFPVAAGVLLLVVKQGRSRTPLLVYTGVSLSVTALLTLGVLLSGAGQEKVLFKLTSALPVYFRLDSLGMVFAAVVAVVWLCAGFFSFSYMEHEENEKRYYGFYLVVNGILNALCFSGNLITFYGFYELLTLLSMPLVLHSGTREAVMAGLKYLFYSFCGAYMALFGVYFLFRYGNTLTFTAGGVLNAELASGSEGVLLIAAFFMLLGFGVKAGMFPLHAWLPTAHPVAPAPASAVLSSVIVKAGVLGAIRTVYYLFGADFIRGTWVQDSWLVLSLITVFMGSMLAYREKGLKKRLAYSTVSQVSYILFGLALLQPTALTGSLLHMVFHGFIKCGLFLVAGAVIFKTGRKNVDELTGIGKKMPLTIGCYLFLSLGLIGIPPASGFISKWYLASGALASNTGIFSWLGPVVLLVSALLTAGYLLPLALKGFLPGKEGDVEPEMRRKDEPSLFMAVPILILTILTIAFGLIPNPLADFLRGIADSVL